MQQMDFLLVGFVKAGTTTLDSILRQDKRIVLPKGIKETHFFDWCDREGALNFFWSNYYPEKRANKVLGGIEPCYSKDAKLCYQIFGENVKLLFMMRNPVKADYSLFKMGLKWGSSIKLIRWLKKYPPDHVSEFYHHYTVWRIKYPEQEDFIREEFRYEKWIQEYLRYYNRNQMKFILFEDFLANPENTVREIEEFIGLEGGRLNCKMHENEGDRISKNYLNARINCWFTNKKKFMESQGKTRKRRLLTIIQDKLFLFTLVKSEERMSKKTEKILSRYYGKTKNYLEQLLDRDLSDVWF